MDAICTSSHIDNFLALYGNLIHAPKRHVTVHVINNSYEFLERIRTEDVGKVISAATMLGLPFYVPLHTGQHSKYSMGPKMTSIGLRHCQGCAIHRITYVTTISKTRLSC